MLLVLNKIEKDYQIEPAIVGDISLDIAIPAYTAGSVKMLTTVRPQYTSEAILEKIIEDRELTKTAMFLSSSTFSRDWQNEDDDKWNSFQLI